MLRYGRLRFLIFGVVPALNTIGLLLFGLGLATNGSNGTERAVPVLIALAAVLLFAAGLAAIKRGRDLGWRAAATLAGLVICTGLGPTVLLLLGYLAIAPGNTGENAFGPPAPAISLGALLWAVVGCVAPWFTAVAAARFM
jgi:uncharacterized membrane protein YhaH (DUF805 family)